MAGTTLGWSSPMMQYILNNKSPVYLSSAQESWMVTYIDIGNVLLSIPSGILMDRLGRKITIFLSIPLTLIGWILILIAREVKYIILMYHYYIILFFLSFIKKSDINMAFFLYLTLSKDNIKL